MSDATIIEIHGKAAGIVARTGRGFAFHAAQAPFYRLEKRLFRSVRDAERAARALIKPRSQPSAALA